MAKAVFAWGCVGLMLVLTGCATMGGGMTPEEEIRAKLDAWQAAFVAKDLDTVMEYYSEDFTNYESPDKAALRDYLQSAIDMGYLSEPTVDMTNVVVTVDGDTATAGPVGVKDTFGTAVINLTLKNEAGGWMIVGQEVDMQ